MRFKKVAEIVPLPYPHVYVWVAGNLGESRLAEIYKFQTSAAMNEAHRLDLFATLSRLGTLRQGTIIRTFDSTHTLWWHVSGIIPEEGTLILTSCQASRKMDPGHRVRILLTILSTLGLLWILTTPQC